MMLLIRDLVILTALLLFGLWNVCTAKKRGAVYLSLSSYRKSKNPKDFTTALLLNVGWVVVILIVMFLRVREFLKN